MVFEVQNKSNNGESKYEQNFHNGHNQELQGEETLSASCLTIETVHSTERTRHS